MPIQRPEKPRYRRELPDETVTFAPPLGAGPRSDLHASPAVLRTRPTAATATPALPPRQVAAANEIVARRQQPAARVGGVAKSAQSADLSKSRTGGAAQTVGCFVLLDALIDTAERKV